MDEDKIILFILLICSISVHEWAHAWVADKLGDPLPRQQKRVTLDPRSHIDPIGTLLIPLIMIFGSAGFSIIGWGKPVQISLPNPKTRKRDDILITLAGPFSNLGESILLLYYQIVTLNAVLFLFNLIPIPPLDGSHLLKNAIRMREETFLKFSKYGFLLLIVLVNIQPFQLAMSSGINQLNSIFFGIFSLLHS